MGMLVALLLLVYAALQLFRESLLWLLTDLRRPDRWLLVGELKDKHRNSGWRVAVEYCRALRGAGLDQWLFVESCELLMVVEPSKLSVVCREAAERLRVVHKRRERAQLLMAVLTTIFMVFALAHEWSTVTADDVAKFGLWPFVLIMSVALFNLVMIHAATRLVLWVRRAVVQVEASALEELVFYLRGSGSDSVAH